jgi:hypothetical protein
MRNQAEQPVPDATPPDPAPPPPTTSDPDPEVPADTDRGFVVPENAPAELDGELPPDVEVPQEQGAADETRPTTLGGELLAMLRAELSARFDSKPEPLGTDTMPLLNKAIAVHHTATVDTPWDGPAAVATMPAEYADLHYCHAWQSAEADASSHTAGDDDVDDKKSSFKFPHHAKDAGPANLAACRNGLARLEDSKIPDADKPGVRAHLQAHLDDAKGDDDAKNHADVRAGDHTHPEIAFAWDSSMTAAFKEAMQ